MPGQSAWPQHAMWLLVAPCKAVWRPEWKFAQEFESGQMIINKRRHIRALAATLFLAVDKFTQDTLFGDKDAFKFG